MSVTHAPGLAHSGAPTESRSGTAGATRRAARPVFPVSRLARALGLGVLCSALVGAPVCYLLVLLGSRRGVPTDLAFAGRVSLVLLVVLAAPLSVMLTHTPSGLRRRWLPVFLAVELAVALLVGWFAGFLG